MAGKNGMQPGEGTLRRFATAAVFLCAACAPAGAAPPPAIDLSPQVANSGAAPFTESWQQMQARDGNRPASAVSGLAAPQPLSASRLAAIRLRARGTSDAARPDGTTPADLPATSPESPGGVTTVLTPPVIDLTFPCINREDQELTFGAGWFPPDLAFAVGPAHVVEMLTGSVAVYTRAGARLSHVSLSSFFTLVIATTTHPRNGAISPRIHYDRASARWFACALEQGDPIRSQNHIILAVSRGSNPLTALWDKYLIPVGRPAGGGISYFTQYDTLGMDANGVYFGATLTPSTGGLPTYTIAATPRGPLVAATPSIGSIFLFPNLADMFGSPQPALSFDPAGPSDRAWFVASSQLVFRDVHYRTLTWNGATPTLSASSGIVTTPVYGFPPSAPALGSTTNIEVLDDSVQPAVLRNGRLWLSRNVGVNRFGLASKPVPDRSACEWLELDASSSVATLVQSGRIFDNSSSATPRFYYYPSLMVNGQGHASLAMSASSAIQFISAYGSSRLVTDTLGTMSTPTFFRLGQAEYNLLDAGGRNRWGEYSAAALDPLDDMSMWTLQPYASSVNSNTWGTWAARFRAPAPQLTFPAATGDQGESGILVTLTGLGFYDPGPGSANRLNVTISGPGVTVAATAYINSSVVNIVVDVAPDAPLGGRVLAIINPDGQSASAASGFTVVPRVVCPILFGDMNSTGTVDSLDVQRFVECFLVGDAGAAGCGCADLNRDGLLTAADIDLFWLKMFGLGVPVQPCVDTCVGDMNVDHLINGRDIALFVNCFMTGPSIEPGCSCADINDDGSITQTDASLLTGLIIGVGGIQSDCL
jgi:hypothetical protein